VKVPACAVTTATDDFAVEGFAHGLRRGFENRLSRGHKSIRTCNRSRSGCKPGVLA
jgi:hypothetical protein